MPAFVASNSVGKAIPEKYRASVEFAAVKNGKAASISELTIGVNDEQLKKLGVKPLSDADKAKIESGAIEMLMVFGDDIDDIDVSKVKNMQSMFYLTKFNGDISNWNVSNVENMSFMFANSQFKGDISKWDLSNVENKSDMFITFEIC